MIEKAESGIKYPCVCSKSIKFVHQDCLLQWLNHSNARQCEDVDREDEVDRNGARIARRLAGQANRNIGGDGNVEDAGGVLGIIGAAQAPRRNAENVVARWEMQAQRLEAHMEQMFDGLDDADGAKDVPFDELVGI